MGEAAGGDVKRKMLKWRDETVEPNIQFGPWIDELSQETSVPLNGICGSQVELNTSV